MSRLRTKWRMFWCSASRSYGPMGPSYLDLMNPPPCTCGEHATAEDYERCQSCGQRYADDYWLPDSWWAFITPKPDVPGAGLLCPDCALARLRMVAT